MARTLNIQEQNVMKNFTSASLTLEEIKDLKEISLFQKSIKFSVGSAVAYRIKETNAILVFGEPKNAIDIEQLKKLYEEKIKAMNSVEDDEPQRQGMFRPVEEEKKEEVVEEIKEEEVTKKELNEEDVALISSQVDASREEIIKALEDSNYDVVNALIKLNNKN